jgi:lysophospholipase L1-like esterase
MAMISSLSTQRQLLFYLLMSLITLIFLLFIGELIARVWVVPQGIPPPPPPRTIDPYQPNPYIVRMRPYLYFHIPHSKYLQARSSYQVNYEINRLGFRGPEILPKQKNGFKRLITIGDSITEGHGNPFNKTFSSVLGEKLRPYQWEVINLGVQGASPLYYAVNLKRYLAVQPDAVLIVIFENDLADDRTGESVYFTLPVLDDETTLLMKTTTPNFFTPWRLYTLLHRGWRHWIHSAAEKIIAKNQANVYTPKEQQAIQAFEEQQNQLNASKIRPKHLVAPTVFDKQWQMSQAYLDYVVDTCRQQGIAVMIANVSITGQEPDLNPAYSEHARLLDEHLSSWAKTRQIPFLSLLPTIIQAIKQYQPFYSQIAIVDDGHPTSQTHALIANALQPWVINNLPHRSY